MIEIRESGLTIEGEADYIIESVNCVDKHGKRHVVPIKRFHVNTIGAVYHSGGNISIKSKQIGTIAIAAANAVNVNSHFMQQLICNQVTLTCHRIERCYASKHNATRPVNLKRDKRNPFESPEREVALHRVLKSFTP